MKLIIAGSRNIGNRLETTFIEDLIMELNIGHPEEVVCGCASGIDFLGMNYGIDLAHARIKKFPADWNRHGKAAGPIRNKEMARYGDVLLLIWDGKSRGSASMKKEMKKLNKPVYEVIIKRNNII